MEVRGYERSFVDEIDLNRFIFNEGMLVFERKRYLEISKHH